MNMKCPVCNVDLLMGERLTVSIDYCPQCRGIWLEKGKLDQIINISGSGPQTQGSGGSIGLKPGNHSESDQYHDHDHHEDHDTYQKKHKKKSFFEELF
jgi:uncharacterized protein